MGDIADWEIDNGIEGINEEYIDYNEDYYEVPPSYIKIRKASGPGKCPKCGKDTVKRIGKYGEFYGCSNYPNCKGSRKL